MKWWKLENCSATHEVMCSGQLQNLLMIEIEREKWRGAKWWKLNQIKCIYEIILANGHTEWLESSSRDAEDGVAVWFLAVVSTVRWLTDGQMWPMWQAARIFIKIERTDRYSDRDRGSDTAETPTMVDEERKKERETEKHWRLFQQKRTSKSTEKSSNSAGCCFFLPLLPEGKKGRKREKVSQLYYSYSILLAIQADTLSQHEVHRWKWCASSPNAANMCRYTHTYAHRHIATACSLIWISDPAIWRQIMDACSSHNGEKWLQDCCCWRWCWCCTTVATSRLLLRQHFNTRRSPHRWSLLIGFRLACLELASSVALIIGN